MEELIKEVKTCRMCGVELNEGNTPPSVLSSHQQNLCRRCRNRLNKEYRIRHAEKIRKYARHRAAIKREMKRSYLTDTDISPEALKNYIGMEVYVEYITAGKKPRVYHGEVSFVRKRLHLESKGRTYRLLISSIKSIGEANP